MPFEGRIIILMHAAAKKLMVCLRVIVTTSGTQMRVRDSSATRIFFKKK